MFVCHSLKIWHYEIIRPWQNIFRFFSFKSEFHSFVLCRSSWFPPFCFFFFSFCSQSYLSFGLIFPFGFIFLSLLSFFRSCLSFGLIFLSLFSLSSPLSIFSFPLLSCLVYPSVRENLARTHNKQPTRTFRRRWFGGWGSLCNNEQSQTHTHTHKLSDEQSSPRGIRREGR